jgi:hypothetical protein
MFWSFSLQKYQPNSNHGQNLFCSRKAPAIGTKIEVKPGLGLGSPQQLGIVDLQPPLSAIG